MATRRTVGAVRRAPRPLCLCRRPVLLHTCRGKSDIPSKLDLERDYLNRSSHIKGDAARHSLPAGVEGDEAYTTGVMLYTAGQWEAAAKVLEQAKDPTHPSVLMLLGKTRIEMADFDGALKALHKCDVLHAGTKGLSTLIESAEWGAQLFREQQEEMEKEERELREEQESGNMGYLERLKEGRDVIPDDLKDNLPLEPEERRFLANHLGTAIDTIGVVYDEVRGRLVMAKKAFPKGAPIFRDTTMVFAPEYLTQRLSPEHVKHQGNKGSPTYCSHCTAPLTSTPTHCSQCELAYCSVECHDKAKEHYHHVECAVLRHDAGIIFRNRLIHKGMEAVLRRWLVLVRVCSMAIQQARDFPAALPWFSYLSYREQDHKRVLNVTDKNTESGRVDYVPSGYGFMHLTCAHHFNNALYGENWRDHIDANKRAIEDEKKYDLAHDKVKANLFRPYPLPKKLGKAVRHGAHPHVLFPFFSLLNHSCLPNAEIRGDTLYATHDISPGDEVCISYTPPAIPTELKYYYIYKNEGWVCRCNYCTVRAIEEQYKRGKNLEGVGERMLARSKKQREQYEDPNREYTDNGMLTRVALER
eukprot:Sspe_Gene.50906::Locus_28279_Transcript_1_1_Confidence_1.000_Length_2945::g.50906::m.50906